MKLLKRIGFYLICLFLLVSLLAGVLWFNLDLLVTNKNLAKLEVELKNKLQSEFIKNIKINWDDFDIRIENLGLINKRLKLSSENSCVFYLNSKFCFDKLSFIIKIKPLSSEKIAIQELTAIDQEIFVNTKDFSSKEITPYTVIQEKINGFKSITESALDFTSETLHLDLDNTTISVSDLQSYEVKLKADLKKLIFGLKSKDLNLESTLIFNEDLREIKDIAGSFNFLGFESILSANFKLQDSELVLNMSGKIKDNLVDLNSSKFLVSFKKDKTVFLLDHLDFQIKNYFEKLATENCSFTLSLESKENMQINCNDIKIKGSQRALSKEFKSLQKNLKSYQYLDRIFSFNLKGQLDEFKILGSELGKAGELNLKLDDIDDESVNLKASLSADFIKSKSSLMIKPTRLDTFVKIKSFQQLVTELSATEFAIPAPLNTLEGELIFASNKVKDFNDFTKFGFTGSTKLVSKNEKTKNQDIVDVNLKGHLKLAHSANSKTKTILTIKVNIDDILLHLPDFNPIRGLPKLNSDSRILPYKLEDRKINKLVSSVEKKSPGFDYNIIIETKNPDSIKIKYQYFHPFVPLGLKAKLTPGGVSYDLYSNTKWKVDYLKREIFVESISLNKKIRKKDYTNLNVKLKYPATNYDIFIEVLGTIDNPIVKLTSSPMLSRADIISVLLYNRTTDDLSRFENESVGGAESAIADKALGLIGIWAFASTPIESVSYDSKSQIYRAQIGLPGGIKFDIGTDLERIQNLSLRKRLNNSWIFVTSFEPGDANQNGVGNLFLQREWIY